MRFRKLRIAFSVTCGIAAVLLCVLWVRSYRWMEQYVVYRNGGQSTIQSFRGVLIFEDVRGPSYANRKGIRAIHHSARIQPDANWPPDTLGISWRRAYFECHVPYWLMTLCLLAGATIGIVWNRIGFRFSLRTLLIATTLVAAVLGLAVYMAGK
jgi:hypothetical protein